MAAMEVAILVALLISQGGYPVEIVGSENLLFRVPRAFLFHRHSSLLPFKQST